MRSFTAAALAALLASIPLATAYAAPRENPGGHGFGESFGGGHRSFDRGFREHRGHDGLFGYDDGYPDAFYDNYYYPNWAPAPSYYVPSSRLSVVLSDLRAADHRIAAARAHGRLTPAEANNLRSREATIRGEAIHMAARDGDRLSVPAYRTVLRQVGGLDRTIAREAGAA